MAKIVFGLLLVAVSNCCEYIHFYYLIAAIFDLKGCFELSLPFPFVYT